MVVPLGNAYDKTASLRLRCEDGAFVELLRLCLPVAPVLPTAKNEKSGTFSFCEQLSGKQSGYLCRQCTAFANQAPAVGHDSPTPQFQELASRICCSGNALRLRKTPCVITGSMAEGGLCKSLRTSRAAGPPEKVVVIEGEQF
jgi:hypothetical protein